MTTRSALLVCITLTAIAAASCDRRNPVLDSPAVPTITGPAPPTVRPAILRLELQSAGVNGGRTANATAVLSLPAEPGGTHVTLSTSDPAVSVPSSITVPVGEERAQFAISTQPVPSDRTASIIAAAGNRSVSAALGVWVTRFSFFEWVGKAGAIQGRDSSGRITAENSRSFDVHCATDSVRISISSDPSWLLAFSPGRGKTFVPGTYEGSTGPGDDTRSWMGASGDGHACTYSEATFTVHAVNLSRANGPLKFLASFDHRCTLPFPFNTLPGASLRGEIRVEEIDNTSFDTFCR